MYKVFIFVLFFFQLQINAQFSEAFNELSDLFHNYEYAHKNIQKGLHGISYCYSIKNTSTLRTQLLYACSGPAESKRYIDQAISKSKKIKLLLGKTGCSDAFFASTYLESLFEKAKSNMQLGAMALMTASEQRNRANMPRLMNKGSLYFKASLTNLSNAADKINEIAGYLNKCSTKPSIPCDELLLFIVENGEKIGDINESALNSSWLKNIECYTYEKNFFVISVVKEQTVNKSEFGAYVYCEVPFMNWIRFKDGYGNSYGKKFHEFIADYKCDCD